MMANLRGAVAALAVLAPLGLAGCTMRHRAEIRRLMAQVPGHAEHWRAQASLGEPLYVALGDSAAQGIGVDDPAHGYVGVVHERMSASCETAVAMQNISVSGATVCSVVETQLPRLRQLPAPPTSARCASAATTW